MRQPPRGDSPKRGDPLEDLIDRIPIVPHQDLPDGLDCCGCLFFQPGSDPDHVELVCNECEAVIRTVKLEDAERVAEEMAQTDTICSATCTYCGAVNTFSGWSSIEAFICSECGEGNMVETPIQ